MQDICRDIKKLDFAKQHLTHTITAFRRLSMLVTAVGAPACTPLAALFPDPACSVEVLAENRVVSSDGKHLAVAVERGEVSSQRTACSLVLPL